MTDITLHQEQQERPHPPVYPGIHPYIYPSSLITPLLLFLSLLVTQFTMAAGGNTRCTGLPAKASGWL